MLLGLLETASVGFKNVGDEGTRKLCILPPVTLSSREAGVEAQAGSRRSGGCLDRSMLSIGRSRAGFGPPGAIVPRGPFGVKRAYVAANGRHTCACDATASRLEDQRFWHNIRFGAATSYLDWQMQPALAAPPSLAVKIKFEAFVKIYRNGILHICAGLILAAATEQSARAQEAASASDASQTAAEAPQNPTSQNPASPDATSQNPTSQNPTSQSPTTQNPATPVPAPQTAPAASPLAPAATQPTSGPIVNAAPELPKYPDVRLPGEYGFYIGVDGWLPSQTPVFNKGRNSGITDNSYVVMQGTPKFGDGAEFGMAVGLHNMLKLSYFEVRQSGDYTAPVDTQVLNSQVYNTGTLVSTDTRVQNLKLSFDYLTWPYPVESRRFRLKTLWQVQYTSVTAGFDAPQLPLFDSAGNPLVDASGNPISYATSGTKWFILPTFGLGATYYITRNIRFEASADGFAIPHHSTLYEGESTLNFRLSHFEVRGGAKLFHYKTSPSQDFYLRGTMAGVFFGIRWYSR